MLTLTKQKDFSLSILFSFPGKSQKGFKIANKINDTDCFSGFTVLLSTRSITYSKDVGNNKLEIAASVEQIAKSLFPDVAMESIGIETLWICGWISIQEEESA